MNNHLLNITKRNEVKGKQRVNILKIAVSYHAVREIDTKN